MQYDGSIRINTQINTQGANAQLMSLENRIVKTADKIASLHAKMDALKDVKMPTQEYKAIESDIAKAEKELEKLIEKQAQMQNEGKTSGAAWENLNQRIQATKDYIEQAKAEQQELVNSGKAFTLGTESEEYKKAEAEAKNYENSLNALIQKRQELNGTAKEMSDAEYMRQAEENIDRVIAKMQERQQMEAETPPELLQPRVVELDTGAFQQGQQEAQALAEAVNSVGENAQESATKSNEAIASMTQELAQLKERQKELEGQGQGLGFEEYDANVQRIAEINAALSDYRRELLETETSSASFKEAMQNAFKMMAHGLVDIPIKGLKAGLKGTVALFDKLGSMAVSALKRTGTAIQKFAISPLTLMQVVAKKAFSSIGKSSKASNNMFQKGFKNILKYGLGIRSVYALINKFRTAVKEGFKNLAQVSAPVNESLSMLKSSLTQLKNSLATAFAPILTTIAPALTALINMLSQAATYVGMFIATLTGASTFTKAIAVQEDYAASLNKTGSAAKKAAGALAKFDDLDVLAQPSSSGGGAGAAETPVTDMFEEVEIPDKFKDLTQWIKDMWAESDFTELGSFLGQRLKEGLDNIPWEEIQENARNIGKSLATLINGAVETEGLGYTIGNTLAQGINTGFNFLNSFVHELHWDSIGTFIANTLNGLFQNIDWNLINDTFVTGAKGLGIAINSFTNDFDWETFSANISNFFNTIIDTIYTFITTTDWIALGEEVGATISDAWIGIDWAKAGETLGEYFKAFFDFVGNAIKAVDWQEVGRTVADFIKGIDWAGVAESFFSAIGAAMGGLAGFLTELIENAWNSVVEWWHDVAYEDGQFTIQGLLEGIAEALVSIGDWIWEHIFQPFMDAFCEAFGIASPSTVMAEMGTYIMQGLLDGITSLVENVTEIWENMKTTALEIWENAKLGLSEKWENMKSTATSIFTSMKESVSKIFDGLWGNIKKIINSILGGVEKLANGVVNAINTVIRALNGLSFDLPTWLPGDLGGKSLSLNIDEIPNVTIPKLATGAVIRGGNPFMAILGDQPAGMTNIETPLPTMVEAFKQAAAEMGMGGGERVPVTINLNYDGETFARLSISDILAELGRQGYNVDVLGAN